MSLRDDGENELDQGCLMENDVVCTFTCYRVECDIQTIHIELRIGRITFGLDLMSDETIDLRFDWISGI